MGKSKSIQEQQKQNQEFQNYLDEIQKNLKGKAKENEEKFEAEIKTFYGDEYGKLIHMGGAEKFDFRQVNEVTLDNLARVVQDTVDAIFPGSKQSEDVKEDVKKAASSIVNYKDMVVHVASSLIMAALKGLEVSTAVNYSCEYKAESLCPGLTLHILVANNSYRSSRWFSNTEIVESYIKYELIFSYQRAGAEIDVQFFNGLLSRIEKYQEALNVLVDRYTEMIVDPSASPEEVDSIEKKMNTMDTQITKARDQVNKAIAEHRQNKLMAMMKKNGLPAERMERARKALAEMGADHE